MFSFLKKSFFAMALFTCMAAPAMAKEITLSIVDEKSKPIEVQVPFQPQRVVCLSPSTVDILDALGLGHTIVGFTKAKATPKHLEKYEANKDIADVGSMKELDMEAIMSLQPDIIFSSDRMVRLYKELRMIAPTVPTYIEYSKGFYAGYKENVMQIAKIFGKEKEAQALVDQFDARLAQLQKDFGGKKAILGIFAGGTLNTLGDVGRISLITHDVGFANLAKEKNVTHGNISSYELLLAKDPEYIFILDKDNAVGADATAAEEQMNNEIVHQTQAYKNKKIIFLKPDNVWYVADGGITSMDIMLKNLEESLYVK